MTEKIRLNKFLSEAGICSRREADRLIESGLVMVDGMVATVGTKVSSAQQVICNGMLIGGEKDHKVLLLVYKPRGVVCTTSDKDRAPNIVDMVGYHSRIYPVGRLDKDSEGLILMTNQGDLVNKIMRSKNHHEKEYQVIVDRPVTDDFLRGMAKGVPVLDVITKPCTLKQTGSDSFRIILTQGLNRQIRRMCEYFGYQVRSLKRVRIMNLLLGDLKPGTYREISPDEYKKLAESLKDSTNLPAHNKK